MSFCESPAHRTTSSLCKGDDTLRRTFQAQTRRWWPFICLLLAGAARWLVADAHPNAAPSLTSAALGCTWAALLLFALLPRTAPTLPSAPFNHLRTLLAGALLFGGPAIGLLLDAHTLSASALTIALALTPVAVAIASSALGAAEREGVAGRIWPGLTAVTGLLLILVPPSLSDSRADIALILAPTLTGLGAAMLEHSTSAGHEPNPLTAFSQPHTDPAAPLALLGAAILLTSAVAVLALLAGHKPTFSLLAIGYDGLIALLSILSLRRLGAMRWSSQFTWLPLLVLLEGILLVRPPVTTRWLTGLVLLAIASVYLLLPPPIDVPSVAPTPVA